MREPTKPASSGRETLLTVVLTGLAAAAILLFLVLVSGGIFLYVALIVLAIGAVGSVHYLLWGQAMEGDVSREGRLDADAASNGDGESNGAWGNPYFKR
jgi:hypothetical protein